MLKTTPQEILEGPILKTLLRLAVPTIIAFVFHTGFNFVDRFFVSRLGELQFGALGMAFTVQMTLIAVGAGMEIGTGSLIARLIGAKKFKEANRAADQALLLIIICAVAATGGGLLLIRSVFHILGASAQMLPFILSYIRIILVGAFFQFFAMMGGGILRGEGDMMTPMKAMVTSNVTNLLLDPLLIFGLGPFPALGVQGAALATVTARMVSCVMIGRAFLAHKNIVKPAFKIFQLHPALIKGILSVGGPAALGHLLHPLGMSAMFFLLKPYGDASKAALTMGLTYQQVAILPIIGIGAASLTMTGQNFGAKNMGRVHSLMFRSVGFAVGVLSCVMLVFIGFRGSFVRVFSDSPAVIAIGKNLLLVASLGLPAIGSRLIHANVFQGLGMGMRALLLNLSQMLCFSLPLAWMFSRLYGLNGIWWGMTTGMYIAAVIGFLWMEVTLKKIMRHKEEKQ